MNELHPGLGAFAGHRPALCAMIHVPALPGTPRSQLAVTGIIERCAAEAELLRSLGVDGLMVENMHDTPYLRGSVGPEIVSAMTAVGCAVREAAPDLALGVQVLAGANREALAVALACGADFIRAEGFVFAHVGDEGLHQACAGDLLRYRRAIGADGVAILADVVKKHSSHALTADIDIAEHAHSAEFFGADGIIVTGTSTGRACNPGDLRRVRESTSLPVAVGSGITPSNVAEYAAADLLVVGSSIKQDGRWEREIEPGRVRDLVAALDRVRAGQG